MRSTIVIRKIGNSYFGTASGKFGGGYQNAHAGLTPNDAATFAAGEMIRYGQSNTEGGDLVAPSEVMEFIPVHLRSIPAREKE